MHNNHHIELNKGNLQILNSKKTHCDLYRLYAVCSLRTTAGVLKYFGSSTGEGHPRVSLHLGSPRNHEQRLRNHGYLPDKILIVTSISINMYNIISILYVYNICIYIYIYICVCVYHIYIYIYIYM